MPHRSKDRNQDIRAQKLAYILHQSGITAEMLTTDQVSNETIFLAESIAGLDTHASEETLAMCGEFLATMDEFDAVDKTPDSSSTSPPISCEGRFGYVGVSNEDLDTPTPIKTSVRGVHNSQSITVKVRLTEDGALELASRMISVARKVMAERKATETRNQRRQTA